MLKYCDTNYQFLWLILLIDRYSMLVLNTVSHKYLQPVSNILFSACKASCTFFEYSRSQY